MMSRLLLVAPFGASLPLSPFGESTPAPPRPNMRPIPIDRPQAPSLLLFPRQVVRGGRWGIHVAIGQKTFRRL